MFAKSILVTRPLTMLMDHISYIESIRHRLRLRRIGLALEESKVTQSENDLAHLNLRLVTGEAGFETVTEFYKLFKPDPELQESLAVWGISLLELVDPVLVGMGDTRRRLVLPYQCQPWQCLKIIRMSGEDGLLFLRQEHDKVSNCRACADTAFFQAL